MSPRSPRRASQREQRRRPPALGIGQREAGVDEHREAQHHEAVLPAQRARHALGHARAARRLRRQRRARLARRGRARCAAPCRRSRRDQPEVDDADPVRGAAAAASPLTCTGPSAKLAPAPGWHLPQVCGEVRRMHARARIARAAGCRARRGSWRSWRPSTLAGAQREAVEAVVEGGDAAAPAGRTSRSAAASRGSGRRSRSGCWRRTPATGLAPGRGCGARRGSRCTRARRVTPRASASP